MFVDSVIVTIIQHVDHVNCNMNRIYLPKVLEEFTKYILRIQNGEITSLTLNNKFLKI